MWKMSEPAFSVDGASTDLRRQFEAFNVSKTGFKDPLQAVLNLTAEGQGQVKSLFETLE